MRPRAGAGSYASLYSGFLVCKMTKADDSHAHPQGCREKPRDPTRETSSAYRARHPTDAQERSLSLVVTGQRSKGKRVYPICRHHHRRTAPQPLGWRCEQRVSGARYVFLQMPPRGTLVCARTLEKGREEIPQILLVVITPKAVREASTFRSPSHGTIGIVLSEHLCPL